MGEKISLHRDGERRRSPRRRNRNATTHFGEVFDLSAGGMSVFRKGAELIEIGEELAVDLHCEHLSAELTVRVVHRECVGFRRHVYGVKFVGLNEAMQAKIGRLIDAACEPCACPTCWIAAA
jgi:c-di-GMP-binding flagellar brake protein YcgR